MKLFIALLEAAARIFGMSREAFSKKLEEAAQEIREGRLLPNEAFERAEADQDRLEDLYEKAKENR